MGELECSVALETPEGERGMIETYKNMKEII